MVVSMFESSRWVGQAAGKGPDFAVSPNMALNNDVSGDRFGDDNLGIVGSGEETAGVRAAVRLVADRRCNVLIQGETGVGKEVVARALHASGARRHGPWVTVNCGAIPEPLLEAELFGYQKGAFTGATQARIGRFEAANHGTIFLDEVGDMPAGIQVKLLRVLQEREVERLGGNERTRLDIRVVAATNVDLAARVRAGLFRQDLYYRLNVFRIELPPLRNRPEDIEALAFHFIRRICEREGIPTKTVSQEALLLLRAAKWPGNVRELENALETAIIVSHRRPVIESRDLRLERSEEIMTSRGATPSPLPPEGIDYQRVVEDFEANLIRQALTRVRGNKTAAANLLRMKRTTLSARMKVLENHFPLMAA